MTVQFGNQIRPKTLGSRPLRAFFILCTLGVLCGTVAAQDFKTFHDGVEYAQVEHKIGNDPVKINLLRLDLTKVRLDVHHAMDAAVGTEKTSSIAKRHGATAAINAGFFRLDTSIFAGESAGVLRINSKFFSEGDKNHPAIGFVNGSSETKAAIVGLVQHRMLTIGGKDLFVGTNRERKENEIIEYTPDFGPTTRTNPDGIEIVVRKDKIVEINESAGSSPIPADGYVISASGEKPAIIKPLIKIGAKVEVGYWTVMDDVRPTELFRVAEDIVSGRGHLIRDAKIILDPGETSKSFVETRHPRTAIAKLKDGRVLMITVDGRQPGVSVGMSLQELAEYLLSLGAVDAMNLDGGGSTTMFLDGKVVNTPSDKEGERKVGDAILVTLRKKPGRK
jgi:hypothetical protein